MKNSMMQFGLMAAAIMMSAALSAQATLVTFAEGDTLDGDIAGSFAGPFGGYLIETVAVAPNGVVNTTAAGLAINATRPDTAASFDPGEAWTFRFPGTAIEFQGIDFDSFSTGTEEFTLSSTAWIGRSYSPTEPEITFNSATGAFTFGSGTASDDFDLTDLTGGAAIWTPANASLVLSYTGGADTSVLADFTFNAVPEPSTLFLLGIGGLMLRRAYRKVRA